MTAQKRSLKQCPSIVNMRTVKARHRVAAKSSLTCKPIVTTSPPPDTTTTTPAPLPPRAGAVTPDSTTSPPPSTIIPSPSSSNRARRRIRFYNKVTVMLIPSRHLYPKSMRQNIWGTMREIQDNARRNAIEFAAEGWDWRTAVEDDAMYLTADGERIHPAHVVVVPAQQHDYHHHYSHYSSSF